MWKALQVIIKTRLKQMKAQLGTSRLHLHFLSETGFYTFHLDGIFISSRQ